MNGKRWREESARENENRRQRTANATEDDNVRARWDENNDQESENKKLHQASLAGDVATVRALLAGGRADVKVEEEKRRGRSALHAAAWKGHLEVVELLLNAGANPNALNMDGVSPLHYACMDGHFSSAAVLLRAGANPYADADGYTALHYASFYGHAQVVELLLNAGASLRATDFIGNTPLHDACKRFCCNVVHLLLTFGADIHAKNSAGLEPMHCCISYQLYEVNKDTVQTLQVLVSFGASWDAKCEELVANGKARKEARAFLVCIELWTRERKAGLPFTDVPVEVIGRGSAHTRTFIDALKKSKKPTFRRRLCVIGPSLWGKTSLIKSLTSGEPSLDHVDNRTIGIDMFSMRFNDDDDEHDIKFWDFAGQEEYQPAHAVFFSERTVYIVCVDLHSTSLAKALADFRADSDDDYEKRMDEFVSRKILRWIRLVFARQPDAEFVLVGTKADVVRHSIKRIDEVKEDLSLRLQAYAVAYQAEVDREITIIHDRVSGSISYKEKLDRLYKLRNNAINIASKMWLTMSCKEKRWVVAAQNDLQLLLVVDKHKSFEMPEAYTQVLNAIVEMRHTSTPKRSRQRVQDTFVSYSDLVTMLMQRTPALTNCREILQTLHDLGDVLWYENLVTDRFQNTVIVDPLLLIDFIRQIFDHNYNGETMPHATLKRRPFWVDVASDCGLVLGLKQLLEQSHLVYPSWGAMAWDSDLMVPVYWRTNLASFYQVVGTPLQLEQGDAKRHVRWEYHFTSELPETVYDHFVVSTYSALQTRVVGPDGILWQPSMNSALACRVVVERDGRYTVIRFEALAAHDAEWRSFERSIEGMETVLREFPGLLVTRYAVKDDDKVVRLEQVVKEAWTMNVSALTWLPPDVTWCYNLLVASNIRGL